MSYRENFDEFGNLRESHSPWELHDLVIVAMAVLMVIALILGAV